MAASCKHKNTRRTGGRVTALGINWNTGVCKDCGIKMRLDVLQNGRKVPDQED